MNIDGMLSLYEDSYFKERDFINPDRVITPGQKKAAERDYDTDPVRCLLENVEQSRDDAKETALRMRQAQQDGLLDRTLYQSADKEERKRWRNVIITLKGDHARALAELAHWRDYVRWAMEEQGKGDTRLPPEREAVAR